jgi:hypothetical protein
VSSSRHPGSPHHTRARRRNGAHRIGWRRRAGSCLSSADSSSRSRPDDASYVTGTLLFVDGGYTAM